MKQRFPFFANIGGRRIRITGAHWSGVYYESEGCGLVPLSVQPIEETREPAGISRQWRTWRQPPEEFKRQGCFKQEPLTPYERKLKADRARSWLRNTLGGGLMPAVEILSRARKAGINEWSLRRAKKHLRIKAVKVGGRRRGYGAKWFWTAATAER